VFFLLLLLIY